MSFKEQLSDYEPLTRAKGKRDARLEDIESEWTRNQTVWPNNSDFEKKLRVSASSQSTHATSIDGAKRPAKPRWPALKETWIVKRGHTISFVGLYLFTFIVFFRPYEWT